MGYFDLAAGTNVQSPVAEMRLHRTASDEPQPEMEPDEEVTTQRNRVEVAQTLQEAAVHGEAGRFEQARSVLEVQEKRMRGKKGKSAISEALQIESQDVFGIVTLQAAEQPELQAGSTDVRQPLDIICVLDVSGSMGGQKLRLVQDAVRFVKVCLQDEKSLH